jgi:bifunctional UDP-N-acetylglucosamine pyrophosphorylase/glucosamine-1-phosphate N-acetyltransferase
MDKLACIILAAGEGTRMKSGYAKVAHLLAGKPLIRYVVEAAGNLEPERIVVVVGHDAERVKKAASDGVEFVEQREQNGTGHAVMQARACFAGWEGDILVLSGDVPLITAETLRKLVEAHEKGSAACTLLTALVKDPSGYGRIIRRASGRLLKIVEEEDASLFEKAVEEINAGVYLINASSLFQAASKLSPENRQQEFYLTDVVSILVGEGMKVETVKADDASEVLGINDRDELARTEKILQRKIQRAHMLNGVTIVDPANTYIEAAVSIGRDTIIYPFSVIEGEVRIGAGCRIGPFSHIRGVSRVEDGAEIGNFVEVKTSLIGAGTKAKHLSYIGDAEIGKDANVGAGAITANYDGKAKHKTVIGDRAFIGSGTTLVAPVRVGKDAITGAGSVVLKGRDVPEGSVVVGIPAAEMRKKSG